MPPRKRAAKKTAAKKPVEPDYTGPKFPLEEAGYFSTSHMPHNSTSHGPPVLQIRRALGVKDGVVFNEETRTALLGFQEERGLPVTGVVARQDWEALFAAPAAPDDGVTPPVD